MGPTQCEQHHQQPAQEITTDSVRKFPIHENSSETGKYRAQFFGQSTVDAPPPRNPGNNSNVSSSSSASQRALRSGALRYATFQGWPHSFLSPRTLSDAGFFYRGTADQTQCAFCCITISQWEPNDDPMTEHRKYAPNCPFVLGLPVGNIPLPGSAGSNSATVSEPDAQVRPAPLLASIPVSSTAPQSSFPSAMLVHTGIDVCGHRQEMRPNAFPQRVVAQSSTLTIRPAADESGPIPADISALRLQMHQRARHPHLATLDARMSTFHHWPAGLAQRPGQLAEAGFYYMGTGDHVKCFCCDGALRNWEPNDDPWVEHSRWFSRCNYLLSIKGEDFVKEVLSRFENGDPWKPEATAPEATARQEPEKAKEETAAVEPTPAPTTTSQDETNKAESSSLKEALLCKICFDQQMSIVFLPCGHSLSCPSCATALSSCPLCRKEIQATVRAFFSFSS